MSGHLDRLSRVYSEETWDVYELLDRSLEPRGREWLHDLATRYIPPGSVILDAGCRDAADLILLVQAHEATGVGVDPVAIHVERAREAVAAAGLAGRIEMVCGVMETLPYQDGSFDFIWCRDVISQVELLDDALSTLARILEPDGRLLIYTTFATDLLAPEERGLLERHLGLVASSLVEHRVEEAFRHAGFAVEIKEVIGSEFKEHAEERSHSGSRMLLRITRLRRLRSTLIQERGEDIYNHIEANLYWELFLFLGKLQPTVYVLKHR